MVEVIGQTVPGGTPRRWLNAYLPVLIWMSVIFAASTDLGSTKHSSRIIGPILRWFNPNVSEQTIEFFQLIFRKSGHLTEYAILAMLVWRARSTAKMFPRLLYAWNWGEAWAIVLCCALYASTDEFHQRFVPTREAQPLDVFIDTTGALCGLLLIWSIGRWRKRW